MFDKYSQETRSYSDCITMAILWEGSKAHITSNTYNITHHIQYIQYYIVAHLIHTKVCKYVLTIPTQSYLTVVRYDWVGIVKSCTDHKANPKDYMNTGCTYVHIECPTRQYSKGISNYDTTINQFHAYNSKLGFIQLLILSNRLTI